MPRKISDKINIDELAKLFDLTEWDKIEEMNDHYLHEIQSQAEQQAEANDEDPEDAGTAAFQEAQTDLFNNWYDAIEYVAGGLFKEHGLELLAMRHTRKVNKNYRPYELKIVPQRSWTDAANRLRETINGVGDFHFHSLRDFLDSGPYTARQAVLAHLSYVRRYPDVYGTPSAQRLYEYAWKS